MSGEKTRPGDRIDAELFFGDPWPKPREDLALHALAEIQALDAAPLARRFRDDWLEGQTVRLSDVRQWAPTGAAVAALTDQVGHLTERYAWTRDQAKEYLLAGRTPRLALFETAILRQPPGEAGNPAASAFTNRIVLTVRPQATKQEVADAYDQLRRLLLQQEGVEVGERNRATSSPRTRDLAVLGYRIRRGDFESWPDAFAAYELAHPDDAAAYHSRTNGKVRVKTFRRDTYNAYERVTGCQLTWHPGLKREEVKTNDDKTIER